jgi:cystathionine beta-lyase/cystathionine gamma-synthase
MKQHAENAQKVAQFLQSRSGIAHIRYPGLENHPQHRVAKNQMSGYAGMLNFSLEIDLLQNFAFLKALKLIKHAVSLGHDQSLILFIPTVFFFDDMVNFDEQQREKYANIMGEGIYRFSVGIEDADAIIADLEQAFQKVGLGKR